MGERVTLNELQEIVMSASTIVRELAGENKKTEMALQDFSEDIVILDESEGSAVCKLMKFV